MIQETVIGSVTLTECLRQTIRQHNADIVFINSGGRKDTLSYSALQDAALNCLGSLQQQGVSAGDEVILQLEDNRTFLICFWACLLGKMIPVPLSIGIQDDHKRKLWNVWNILTNPFIIADNSQATQIEKYARKEGLTTWLNALQDHSIDPAAALAHTSPGTTQPCATADIAYIQFSSGSTGDPKGVVLTHENLYFNTRDISERCNITTGDTALSWMPLTHDMGLIGFHLTAMLKGIRQCIIATPAFIRRPLSWMDNVSAYNASILYSPNFGYEYLLSALEHHGPVTWDLSAVRVIYNGAEPISVKTCNRFLDKMAAYGMPRAVMNPCYGLAEASVAATIQEPGRPIITYSVDRDHLKPGDTVRHIPLTDKQAVTFVEVGTPIDHCQVSIQDEQGNTLNDQQIGHIRIKGKNVTAGYYNRPDATTNTFTATGWLKTGDLGFWHNDRLVVTGRAKNLIIIKGQNYYPQDLERALEDIPGLETGKVAAAGTVNLTGQTGGEELLIFVLFKGNTTAFLPLADTISRRLMEQLALLPDKIIPINKMPKTTSGKVQYFHLVTRYTNGEFDAIIQELQQLRNRKEQETANGTQNLLQSVLTFLSDLTGHRVTAQDAPLSIGLNSLQMMILINHLQATTGKRLNIEAIFGINNLEELEAQLGNATASDVLTPAPATHAFPLSHAQQRMWIQCEMQGKWNAFNLSAAAIVKGNLDLQALQQALTILVERHAALRTVFSYENGNVQQQFLPVKEVSISRIFSVTAAIPEQVAGLISTAANTTFAPDNFMWRCQVLQHGTDEHILQFTFHHLIFDGWSLGIWMKELNECYQHCLGQQQLSLPAQFTYNDFVGWERKILEQETLHEDKLYWQQDMADYLPELGALRQARNSAVSEQQGAAVSFRMPATLVQKLEAFSRQQAVTTFMSLYAALNLLYYKLTGRQDIVFGTESAGRTRTEWEPIIGYFLNTLPIRSTLNGTMSFGELLQIVKHKLLNAYKHQQYPVDLLVNELSADTATQLFDVLVVYQNFGHNMDIHTLGNLEVQPLEIPEQTAIVDLHLEFIADNDDIQLKIRYNARYYDNVFVQHFYEQLCCLLDQVIASPDTTLSACSLLSLEEKNTILHTFNQPVITDAFQPLTTIIDKQAKATPDNIALSCENRKVSYAQLSSLTDQIAASLQQQHRVNNNARIALLMSRSEDMIIALIAILKAGAAYIPMEITWPASRIRFMLANSEADYLITDQQLSDQQHDTVILQWQQLKATAATHHGQWTAPTVSAQDLAYLLYTSGTTGQPKGVLIEHSALADYVTTFQQHFSITSADVIIQQAALTFDTHVEEIYPALSSGATVVIIPEGGKDIAAIVAAVEEEKVSVLSTTPLVIQELNEHPEKLSSLRLLISGGDELKPAYIDRLINQMAIFNTYGPTESTVCAAYQEIKTLKDTTRIGKPIRNRNILILDNDGQLLPIGIAGEIAIGGAGLARGYQQREQETANRFVWLNEEINSRLYRTGDRGRWNNDGSITFLGRTDDQVKIRGYRIELTEIEKALAGHAAVKDIAARIWGEGDHKFIAVYYVTETGWSEDDMRGYAISCLPEYMLPAAFVSITAMPQSANGKTDRSRLPYPVSAIAAQEGLPPASQEEIALADIWKEVLQITTVHLASNFFHIGGNSIKAAKIAGRLRELGWSALRMSDFFLYPTIGKLALQLKKQGTDSISGLIERATYPVTNAQRRLWYMHQLGVKRTALNLSWAYRIKGKLDHDAFKAALQLLVRRHDNLRTVFIEENDAVVMKIVPPDNFPAWFEYTENNNQDWLLQESKREFDLAQGPLLHVTLVKEQEDQYLFLLSLHHIITDGWSMQIFIKEFNTSYHACKQGDTSPLEPLDFRFHDYALQYDQLEGTGAAATHQQFWKDQLKGDLTRITFPPRAERTAHNSNRHTVTLGNTFLHLLQQQVAEQQVSTFIGLQAVLNALLYKYTGSKDILLGTDTAHRPYACMENAMGYFLHELVIRTTFTEAHSLRDLITAVREKNILAYEHQAYPYDKDTLPATQSTNATPLFNILMLMQNFERTHTFETLDETLEVTPLPLPFKEVMTDLQLECHQLPDGQLTLDIRYDTSIFDHAFITQFFQHFEQLGTTLLSSPDAPIATLELLQQQEIDSWLNEWNNTEVDYGTFVPLATQFEQQAAATPAATAIQCGQQTFTYQQLNEAANQLAQHLLQHQLAPGRRTGLLMNRSTHLPVSILAILKAGNTYVPLEPEYPQARLQHIAAETALQAVITEPLAANAQEAWLSQLNIPVIDAATPQQAPSTNPGIAVGDKHIAYIIYTSGSTGLPKGVQITQSAMIDYVQTFAATFGISAQDNVIQQSAVSFDTMVEEMFPVLIKGGKLCIAPLGGRDIDQLSDIIHQCKATVLSTTPHVIGELNRSNRSFPSLNTLISGGEILRPSQVNNLLDKVRIFNTYGPSESTVCATWYEVKNSADSAVIGRPFANREVYLLDADKKLLPPRAIGEIFLGGKGLTAGYVKTTATQADSFLPNPYRLHQTLYRTGDLGYIDENNNLRFVGRIDDQFKVRGYRVEAGEIENACRQLGRIDDLLLSILPDQNKEAQLVLYYTTKDGTPVTDAYHQLSERLPFYMIPARFIHLQQFPLTISGKIDRKALPAPDSIPPAQEEHLQTSQEIALAALWKEVLGVNAVARNDHFFLSGGNSLNGTKLLNKIRKYYSRDVQLRDLFLHPVLHQLATVIATAAPISELQMPLVEEQDVYAVSFAQKRMWVLHQLDEQQTAYNISFLSILDEQIDEQRLHGSIQTLINRHESLRTNFPLINGVPVQHILQQAPAAATVTYLDIADQQEQDAQLEKIAASESATVFNLEQWPLFRITCVKIRTGAAIICTMHHIIADGQSVNLLVKELFTAYAGVAPQPFLSPAPQYKEYAVFQQERLLTGQLDRQRDYWLEQFKTPPAPLEIPGCLSRPASRSFKGHTHTFTLQPAEIQQLNELTQAGNATGFMALLSLVAAFLHRYTGTQDLVLGIPVSGRTTAGLEKIAGLFVNTLPLRLNLDGELSYQSLLQHVRQTALKAYENQDYPFDLLVDALQLGRDLTRSPLFDVMVVMLDNNSYHGDHPLANKISTYRPVDAGISKFDLNFDFETRNDQLEIRIQFNTDIFTPGMMQQCITHFRQLVKNCLAQPQQQLKYLSYLAPEEEKMLLAFNPPAQPSEDESFITMLEDQASKTPAAEALVFGQQRISFREFNNRVNQLANHLITAHNVRSGELIGVSINRSEKLIITIWAIIKAGAAYVPIDPAYPEERRAFIIQDSGIQLVLTESNIDSINWQELPATNPGVYPAGEEIAYAIYTSGTTGQPKGVRITHAGLNNLVMWMGDTIYNQPGTRLKALLTASVNFDASVQQLFAPLAFGHSLTVISEETRRDIKAYAGTLIQENIQVIDLTPSFLNVLLTELEQHTERPSLAYILAGGEPLDRSLVKRCQQLLGEDNTLINVYGVTEATVNSTWELADTERNHKTIGKPLRNTSIYLLDNHFQQVPVGTPAQICIGGIGVGKDYLNKPELTARKFVTIHIAGQTQSIYLTGDTGKWLPDGTIEFIGRMDRQVKLRGYRIELGEIEAILLSHPAVAQAYVALRNENLLAFYQTRTDLTATQLENWLKDKLPLYMIPAGWIPMTEFPVTQSGKINEAALPFPGPVQSEQETQTAQEPADSLIRQIKNIWTEVLQRQSINLSDNFFLVGGHSLTAMLLASRLSKELQLDIRLQDIFTWQTIREQASHFRKQATPAKAYFTSFEQQEHYPLSYAQQRLWIIDQQGGSEAYYIPAAYILTGTLNITALQQACAGLINRHEVLRTGFRMVNGEIRQFVNPAGRNFELEVLHPPIDIDTALEKLKAEKFDLSAGNLIRASLLRISEKEYHLVMLLHHIISDGWSARIILKELTALYNYYLTAQEQFRLPAKNRQYKDTVLEQRQWLTSEDAAAQQVYWTKQLQAAATAAVIPHDFVAGNSKEWSGKTIAFEITATATAQLNNIVQQEQVSLHTCLLAVACLVTYTFTNQQNTLLSLPVAGRKQDDMQDQVGFYVNTLPVTMQLDTRDTGTTYIRKVHHKVMEVLSHQHFPLELVEETTGTAANKRFNTLFVFDSISPQDTDSQAENIRISAYEVKDETTKYDMTILFQETPAALNGMIKYRPSVFSASRIALVIERIQHIIGQLTSTPTRTIDEITAVSNSLDNNMIPDFSIPINL